MRYKLNLLLALASLLTAALACNYSFTTANISGLKISREKNAATETSNFESGATVYIVAQISNTSDKHKVTSRVLYDDVQGHDSGKPVPGAETSVEVPGATAATFTLTPPGTGWEAGKYKVEVVLKNESGKEIDQKSSSFSVEKPGSAAPVEESKETPAANTNSASSSSIPAPRLTDIKITTDDSSEPERSQETFGPLDSIYVMYTMKNVSRGAHIYCNMYMDSADKTLVRSLSYMNPPESEFVERFDFDPRAGWATGPYLIELSYRPGSDAEPVVLKTLKLNVR